MPSSKKSSKYKGLQNFYMYDRAYWKSLASKAASRLDGAREGIDAGRVLRARRAPGARTAAMSQKTTIAGQAAAAVLFN